jgi:hypothetical protein
MRADDATAAAMMTQRLGFTVTRSNVRNARHEGIVSWQGPGRGGGGGKLKNAQRVAALEDRVAALEEMVLRLIDAHNAAAHAECREPMRAPEAWVSK